MIIGLKCDDEENRVISYYEGKELAKSLDVPFFEVSSKKSINVEESIQYLVHELLKKEIEYVPPQLVRKPKTVNETIHFFTEKTSKQLGDILFDTSIDNWEIGNCSITNKLLKKSHILIVVIQNEYVFGCYFPSTINYIGKYCESNKCFIFSLNNNDIYPIKPKQKALYIHKNNEERLLTIGKEDIVIFKKQKKDKSYCEQESFDYKGYGEVLIRQHGENNPFKLDRVVIFQMI